MLCICDTKPPLLGRSRDNPLGRRATTADSGTVWRGFSYVDTLVDGLYQYVRSEDESIASIHSGSSAGLGGLGGLGGFGVDFGVGFVVPAASSGLAASCGRLPSKLHSLGASLSLVKTHCSRAGRSMSSPRPLALSCLHAARSHVSEILRTWFRVVKISRQAFALAGMAAGIHRQAQAISML